MTYGLLILIAAIACVTARYTVPVPLHYDIEKAFQAKVTGIRWDPTNYLTYLAAMFAQCTHYNEGLTNKDGLIPNGTAYTILQKYFDPSLLQSNLVVYMWDGDSPSGESQDAGSIDRDIRTLYNAKTTAAGGAISNVPTLAPNNLRGYDRFGCSVDIKCQSGNDKKGFMLVCIFGQSVQPRAVSGTGGSGSQPQPARPQPQPQPARPQPQPQPAKPVTRTTSTGGMYETYREHSTEYYDTVATAINPGTEIQNYRTDAVITDEAKLKTMNLCTYESNPTAYTKDALTRAGFPSDVEPFLSQFVTSPLPTQQDMTATPLSQSTKSLLQSTIGGTRLTLPSRDDVNDLACAWAICTRSIMVGCAAWGSMDYSTGDTGEQTWKH